MALSNFQHSIRLILSKGAFLPEVVEGMALSGMSKFSAENDDFIEKASGNKELFKRYSARSWREVSRLPKLVSVLDVTSAGRRRSCRCYNRGVDLGSWHGRREG